MERARLSHLDADPEGYAAERAEVGAAALAIHLTAGRIETHFFVFVSLAALGVYRDWRVLVTATTLAVLDHLLRGALWPHSVYGVASASPWRSLECIGWILLADAYLVVA